MNINLTREEIMDLSNVLSWNITRCLGVSREDVIERRKVILSKLESLLEQV